MKVMPFLIRILFDGFLQRTVWIYLLLNLVFINIPGIQIWAYMIAMLFLLKAHSLRLTLFLLRRISKPDSGTVVGYVYMTQYGDTGKHSVKEKNRDFSLTRYVNITPWKKYYMKATVLNYSENLYKLELIPRNLMLETGRTGKFPSITISSVFAEITDCKKKVILARPEEILVAYF